MPVYRGDIPQAPQLHEYQKSQQSLEFWARDLSIYLENYLAHQAQDIRETALVADTITSLSEGSVLFAGDDGYPEENNSYFFWDNTNIRLGIGTASPGYSIYVSQLNASIALSNTGAGAADYSYVIFSHQLSDRAYIRWHESTDDLLIESMGDSADGEIVFRTGGSSSTYDCLKLAADNLTFYFSTQDYLFTKRTNELSIQGQTSGTYSAIDLFAKDGDGTDNVTINLFAKGLPSDVTNREYLTAGYLAASTKFIITTAAAGTGTVRSLSLYTGANTTQCVLNTNGTVSFGSTISTATGSTIGNLTLGNGSITDSGGAISFGDENLTTSGYVITQRVQGYGDADTYFVFTADQVQIWAGGAHFVTCSEVVFGDTLKINPAEADIDTQISGDSVTALFYVDAGSDKIGINDAAPGEIFDVNGNINVTGVYKVDDTQVIGNQQAHVADAGAAAGDPPTQAEFNAFVTQFNELLTKLETHGILANA